MSYDLGLKDPVINAFLELDKPHQMKGGVYCLEGCTTAELNVTYNYSEHFSNVFEPVPSDHRYARARKDGMLHGIRSIYGMTGAESVPVLKRAISMLGDETSDDYWEPTEGNVKQSLTHCLALAQLRPDGIWDGD